MSDDYYCWLAWILKLINKRANVGTSTLEALKDVPFLLDAVMAADALHNHRLIALISGIVKVSRSSLTQGHSVTRALT